MIGEDPCNTNTPVCGLSAVTPMSQVGFASCTSRTGMTASNTPCGGSVWGQIGSVEVALLYDEQRNEENDELQVHHGGPA